MDFKLTDVQPEVIKFPAGGIKTAESTTAVAPSDTPSLLKTAEEGWRGVVAKSPLAQWAASGADIKGAGRAVAKTALGDWTGTAEEEVKAGVEINKMMKERIASGMTPEKALESAKFSHEIKKSSEAAAGFVGGEGSIGKEVIKEAGESFLKSISSKIAATTEKDAVFNIIKSEIPNIVEKDATTLATKLAPITDEAKIAEELKAFSATERAVPTTQVPTHTAGEFPALEKSSGILKKGQDIIAESEKTGIHEGINKAMVELYDKYYPINQFMGDVEKKIGRKLTAEENTYIGARMYSGVGGKITAKLGEFGDILKDASEHYKSGDLSNYLFNQRMIERAKRGIINPGGITGEEATKAISELEQKLGPEKFNELQSSAAKVYNYGDTILQYARDNRFISEKDYAGIKAKNEMYVPFDVIEHMIDTEGAGIGGKKAFSTSEQDLFKTMTGTTKEIDDPINAIIRKTIKTIDRIERNNVTQSLYELRLKNPELSDTIIPMREASKVERRREIFKSLFDLKRELIPQIRELRKTTGMDKVTSRELINIEKEITNTQSRLAKELTGFFQEGEKVIKERDAYTKLKTIPLKLQAQAEQLKKEFPTLKSFIDSTFMEKELTDGTLEAHGFKSKEDFWSAVKEPFTKVLPKKTEEVMSGSISKMTELNKRIAQLSEKSEFTEVQKASLEDSKMYLNKIIDDINYERKALKDELSGIKDITKVPEGYEKVNFMQDGIKSTIAVPREVADAMNRMSAKQVDMITKMASLGSRMLRLGATGLNIAFMVPNVLRDFGTAVLVSKHGFGLLYWSKGFWEAIKATGAEYGLKVDDSVFKAFQKAGGEMGGYYSTYLTNIPSTAKDITKPEWKKLLGLLNPLKTISEFGKISEMSTRLGVFQKALSKGATTREAAFSAREATVDFSKMGDTMKVFNMWVPFVNARIQGTVNVGKAVADAAVNPKKAAELTLKVGGIAIAPFVAAYANNVTRFPEVWDDIADYEKKNNAILIYGNHKDESGKYDQVIKIPKGEFQYFIDPVEDILNYTRGKNPDLFKSIIVDAISDISPVSITPQDTIGETALQATGQLLPPPVKAGVETLTNKNLYTMRDIVPRSMQEAKASEQYKKYTPLIAKEIGSWLGISPLKLENAMGTMFGGLGRQTIGIAGTVEKPRVVLPTTDIARRFTEATGGEIQRQEERVVSQYKEEGVTETVVRKRAAEKFWQGIKSATSEEEVKNIISDIKMDDKMRNDIKSIAEDEIKQIEFIDKEVIALPIEQRAKYIVDKIFEYDKSGNTDQLQLFMSNMDSKGIITPDVRTAIGKELSSRNK